MKTNVMNFETFKAQKLEESYEQMSNYMFFSNLETIKRKIEQILAKDFKEVDKILSEHDWASDHVSAATENINQVCDFLCSTDHSKHDEHEKAEHEKAEHEEKEEKTDESTKVEETPIVAEIPVAETTEETPVTAEVAETSIEESKK